MRHFLALGSHPWLALAEAKAVISGPKPEIMGSLAVFDVPAWSGKDLQDRLAGTIKLGDIILDVPVADLTPERLADELEARPRLPAGKQAARINFGLTVFGGSNKAKEKTKSLALKLKRTLQERQYSVRWVTGDAGSLSPAAVAKMKLTTEGFDLCIGLAGERALVGLTTHVQDADAWSLRDYGRPFRDAKTGMLPPKLARLLVNLAVGSGATRTGALLDPFCGGGTVLMEAALLGVSPVIGSDIDARQVAGAQQNSDWMVERHLIDRAARANIQLLVHPVETLDQALGAKRISAIVTEGYLGEPLRGEESLQALKTQAEAIAALWRRAFMTFAKLEKTGDRVVCIWPVFVSSQGTVAVDLKADVESLGYRLVDPLQDWIDKPMTLTYARPDQRVKRNVLVLEKR